MIIIAHRANTYGPDEKENSVESIERSINLGFDVELDIRIMKNKIFLGHDFPQYEVSKQFLIDISSNAWFHCKDFDALKLFSTNTKLSKTNFFFHNNEDYVLTNKKYVWTYPGKQIFSKSILVLPETLSMNEIDFFIGLKPYGICTDYPMLFNQAKTLI